MKLIPYTRKSTPARIWPDTSRLFEDFFNDFGLLWPSSERKETWSPAVDIFEKKGELILRAELPGMEEKDIDLKLEGNVLTLRGERKFEKEDKESNFHRVESFHGSFSRSFTLPDTIDRDKIKAEYKNGVLTVTMPHKPEVQPREIPVSVH